MSKTVRTPIKGPDEAANASRYANVFNIGHNAFEVVIEFGQQLSDAENVTIHTSIVTLPIYAQALNRALGDSLSQYEAQFGEIPGEPEAEK